MDALTTTRSTLALPAPTQVETRTSDTRFLVILAYAGFWVSGLILLLTSSRREVRLHAAQSLLLFGGLQVLHVLISFSPIPFRMAFLLGTLVIAAALTLWIRLVWRALDGTVPPVRIPQRIGERVASWTPSPRFATA